MAEAIEPWVLRFCLGVWVTPQVPTVVVAVAGHVVVTQSLQAEQVARVVLVDELSQAIDVAQGQPGFRQQR